MDKRRAIAFPLLMAALLFGLQASTNAQDGGLSVIITDVDSTAFPVVEVGVVVLDADGLPVTGLREKDIEIVQGDGGILVPSVVAGDTRPELSLVIGLDLSVAAESLVEIKDVIASFLDDLGPTDQVAVMIFADQVQIAGEGFVPPDEARQLVDALAPGGSYTALNQAVLEAAKQAYPQARKAAIILTDSPDNSGRVSLSAALDELGQVGEDDRVPIYIVGFGPKMARPEAAELQRLAQAMGGQSFALANCQEARPILQMVRVVLQQGYRVTFRSDLPADGATNSFSLRVRSSGREGKAEGSLEANPRMVSLKVSGLADGQTVGGLVYMAAVVDAAAAVDAVEYWVDGTLLATRSEAPYDVTWNTSAAGLGPHTIAIQAVDAAGNEGGIDLSVVVASPVNVAITSLPGQVQPGEPVSVEAQVASLADVAAVDVLLDGEVIDSAKGPEPGNLYRFVLDTSRPTYRPGTHLIAVRATDSLGRLGENSRPVSFLAPPTPTPLPTPTPVPEPEVSPRPIWLGDALVIGTGILAILAAIVLTPVLFIAQRRRRRLTLPLQISNLGNMPSRYELRVEEPDNALKTRWSLRGEALPQRSLVEGVSATQTTARSPSQESPEKPKPAVAGVKKASQIGTAVAGVLDTVAGVLPASLRSPLWRVTARLRSTRSTVDRVRRTPATVARRLSRGRLPGGRLSRGGLPQRSARSEAGREAPDMDVQEGDVLTWSQTPSVGPGETLTVDLTIDPLKPYRTQQPWFRVVSRSIEQEDAPLVIEEQHLQLSGVPWYRRFWPFVLLYTAAVGTWYLVFWWVGTGGLVR